MPTLKQLLIKLKTQLTQCKCFPFVWMIFQLKIYKKKAPATFVVKETRNGMKFQSLFPIDNYGVCSVGSGICDIFLAMVLKLARDAERCSLKRAVYLKEEWVDWNEALRYVLALWHLKVYKMLDQFSRIPTTKLILGTSWFANKGQLKQLSTEAMKDWWWTVTFGVLILEKISFYYWPLLKGYQSKKHALTWKRNSSELLSLGVTLKVSLAISV